MYDDLRMDLFKKVLKMPSLGAEFKVNTAVRKLDGRLELRGTVTVGDNGFSLHVPIEDQEASAKECAPIVRKFVGQAIREREVELFVGEEL